MSYDYLLSKPVAFYVLSFFDGYFTELAPTVESERYLSSILPLARYVERSFSDQILPLIHC